MVVDAACLPVRVGRLGPGPPWAACSEAERVRYLVRSGIQHEAGASYLANNRASKPAGWGPLELRDAVLLVGADCPPESGDVDALGVHIRLQEVINDRDKCKGRCGSL